MATELPKTGRYASIDDAVKQKQAHLLEILASADFSEFSDAENNLFDTTDPALLD